MPQLAGEDILASDIKVPRYIPKSASESVTSSTTLQDDNDFVVELTPGTWRIELMLHWSGDSVASGVGDIKTAWTTTGTMTLLGRWLIGGGTNFVSATEMPVRMQGAALATAVSYQGNATNSNALKEDILLDVDVTGNLQLQWAQNASSAVATTVQTVSRMYITEMEAV